MEFLEIGLIELIDIALVAVLIYQLYKLVRGTVAINIFIGLAAIYLLWKIVDALQGGLKAEGFNIGTTTSCVTPVILKGDVAEATHLTLDLRENFNIFCSIVVYPVVPKDMIMLRLIPTAAHSLEDVAVTIKAFQDIKGKLASGEYKAEKLAAFN